MFEAFKGLDILDPKFYLPVLIGIIVLSFIFTGFPLLGIEPAISGAGNMYADLGVLPFLVVLIYGSLNA